MLLTYREQLLGREKKELLISVRDNRVRNATSCNNSWNVSKLQLLEFSKLKFTEEICNKCNLAKLTEVSKFRWVLCKQLCLLSI